MRRLATGYINDCQRANARELVIDVRSPHDNSAVVFTAIKVADYQRRNGDLSPFRGEIAQSMVNVGTGETGIRLKNVRYPQ